MTQSGGSELPNGNSEGYGSVTEVAQRGSRRRKLAGYLKAANEIRQSYQQSYTSRGHGEDEIGVPGTFPDVAIVRNGDEEMVLFPSYARRHVKKEPSSKDQEATSESPQHTRADSGTGDAEFWKKEWEKYEDDNAVVDVDVRGWMYSPHRGPVNRKNRILIGLARHLSGVPAPSTGSRSSSRPSSPHSSHLERLEAKIAPTEEVLVEKEAEKIAKRGELEADIAQRGGYSDEAGQVWDKASIHSMQDDTTIPSPCGSKDPKPGQFPHPLSDSSPQSSHDDAPGPGSLSKRGSWNHPSDMSPEELSIANAHLMARLKPFLFNPLAGTPLTVFFYNDQTSQSRTIMSNEAGHFSVRAALDFVPTHVRVLASENLSATEEVLITEPTGVSLISDIDDTIKHSGIGSGTKEIFRNVFIRDLGDLVIEGVKEWYTKLAENGVKLHYVSNSPWQLYPVLVSFFAMAGLPPGSFHLKLYSGMLQGIFEPVAERKKGTLEKILRDFPERRFLLVGDSGEADLELYTEIVVANPRRILGVFIRDVTTPLGQGFFDASMGSLNGDKVSNPDIRGASKDGHGMSPNAKGLKSKPKPVLPPRIRTGLDDRQRQRDTDTLIDISDDVQATPSVPRDISNQIITKGEKRSTPPVRPSKPLALRSSSGSTNQSIAFADSKDAASQRRGPVPPPKPRKLSVSQGSPQYQDSAHVPRTQNEGDPGSRATSSEGHGYRSTVRNKVASAYNSLPSPTSYWYGTSQNSSSSGVQERPGRGMIRTLSTSKTIKPPPPLPPPRKPLTSYPAAAAQYATHRISGGWSGANEGSDEESEGSSTPPVNKKLELWKRRWARAKEVLDSHGVMLRTWRVGTDVMDDAVRLVERAKSEMNEAGDHAQHGKGK